MYEEFLKDFTESINNIPPLLRYPALLMITNTIQEELPKAKKAYNKECEDMFNRFMELVREVSVND